MAEFDNSGLLGLPDTQQYPTVHTLRVDGCYAFMPVFWTVSTWCSTIGEILHRFSALRQLHLPNQRKDGYRPQGENHNGKVYFNGMVKRVRLSCPELVSLTIEHVTWLRVEEPRPSKTSRSSRSLLLQSPVWTRSIGETTFAAHFRKAGSISGSL
jgi:hypothetical protein